uniref:RNA-directed DNA polymerase n=1 Tax=Bos mutus grunniens TaxID=30521 RepID=A0A8C0A434_BOSMU
MEKKCKKAKWLSGEALQIAVKRREVKSKGEKERYKHLNAEFQRIARRDKKAFFSDQCKEIEENNRMGKTRDLFKKIRDTKGTFHAKMGSIKDRNGMDLTEAEDIKKRWQEYTEELYKKDLHDPDNHDGVITDLEPDILECEVKWALESITTNKASGGDRIPVELFQILKDDAVKVLHSICQQIWKTQQEAAVRTGHGTTNWFQIGKGVLQGCILSPCLFNLYAEYIMRNAGLEETQAGIKIAGRNINNLRYADDTTLMAESEEELKSLLMKVKVESEKVGLKLNIQKTKIMASSPITSWEIDGETVETVPDFIFLGSKITADGDRSHEIKRRLLLGRKVMTNLDSIFKSRDVTLPTKVHLVKAMVFPVVMYGCECWSVKKAERRRIDAFELWCWRRLLRVPWTARRSNQSILKEISPGISLEGMMLKLKLQYFGHLM